VVHNGPVDVGKKQFEMFTALVTSLSRTCTDNAAQLPTKPETVPDDTSMHARRPSPSFLAIPPRRSLPSTPRTVTQTPFRNTIVNVEFYQTGKLNSTLSSGISHNTRGIHGNLLINVTWEDDEGAGLLGEARKTPEATKAELGEYAGGAIPYGNAGQSTAFLHCETEVDMRRVGPWRGGQGDEIVWECNYPKLQKVKAKYDPDCAFRGWCPIQPAMF